MIDLGLLQTAVLDHVDNPLGLYFFLALIPLILLYLIRPRPDEKNIPSLMFLMKQFQKQTQYSFLRRFANELLFLLQFLIFVLIATAASHPVIKTDKSIDAEFTVLVLDTSASMQMREGFGTRFDVMIDRASDYLDGSISIILVKDTPYIALEDGDKSRALEVLSLLKPTVSLSPLGTSILAAGDLLQEKDGRVVVISDFVQTDDIDPWVAKKTLEAKGIFVEFIDLSAPLDNVGFVEAHGTEKEVTVTLKNYNNDSISTSVLVNEVRTPVTLSPQWTQTLTFAPKPGLNTLKLERDDAFSLDNTLTISIPAPKQTSIVFLSNNDKNFVLPVLEAYQEVWNSDVVLESGTPPLMPVINHNIIVIDSVKSEAVPSAVTKRIASLVEEGSTLIIYPQEHLDDLGLSDLLPVTIQELSKNETIPYNTYALPDVTSDINFASAQQYYHAQAKEGATVLAQTAEDEPLVAVHSYGEGKVVYIGLMDATSRFKYDVSYPLFWQQLLDYVIGKDTFETLNYRIGDIVLFETPLKITTPTQVHRTDELLFNELGVYSYSDRMIASNLLNKVESAPSFVQEHASADTLPQDKSLIQVKKPLITHVIIAFLALLFIELLYVKGRGDL